MTRALLRRSPLERWHEAAGAEFVAVDGARAPARYPLPADPRRCALGDLTALPRAGFKGWRLWDELERAGIACPKLNNTASEQAGGGLCLRLGDGEALLLGELCNHAAAEGFYPVPRRDTHAWLYIAGGASPALLARLCAVDFRPRKFPSLRIAQTMAAGVSVVVLRRDDGGVPGFHVLVDATSAEYLWLTLLSAGREYGARPIGLEAMPGGYGRR